MKRKMHYQIHPRETVLPRCAPVHVGEGQVKEEIENFLQALDSYPARVAKDPGVSFHQHLSSFFTTAHSDSGRDNRTRRQ
jgi:hypothetical protein